VSGVVNSCTIIFCGTGSSKNTDSIVPEFAGDVPIYNKKKTLIHSDRNLGYPFHHEQNTRKISISASHLFEKTDSNS
jgi:hypothetical protein